VTGDDESSNSDSIDDEEEGGEWITEENLYKHLSHGVSLPIVPTEGEAEVSVPVVNQAGIIE